MSWRTTQLYRKRVEAVQRAFLDQVRREIDRQKINQSELARRSGCSRANISLLLDADNEHSLTVRTAIRIAGGLGMNVRLDLTKGYCRGGAD